MLRSLSEHFNKPVFYSELNIGKPSRRTPKRNRSKQQQKTALSKAPGGTQVQKILIKFLFYFFETQQAGIKRNE